MTAPVTEKPIITTTEPSGLTVETDTAIVQVPQRIEAGGGDAVTQYVQAQITAHAQA